MEVAIEIRKRLRAIVWPLAFACISVYFGVHLVQNDHGLMALQAYDARLAAARGVAYVDARGDRLNPRDRATFEATPSRRALRELADRLGVTAADTAAPITAAVRAAAPPSEGADTA